uniref:Outer membrane efflux protein n=2 Tax=Candidatus Criblamydia sequanensis TaxID=340071 RepID=A0A090D147_9BACT|nr:Outer membrane efflux protein [Criblamydia sequanensis CRIB-18]
MLKKMPSFRTTGTFSILCLLSFGCTRIPQTNDNGVSSIVNSRIAKEAYWNQGCYEDERIANAIQVLIQQELTADVAVQIALLNNPKIQEIFEEIGIAQADLVEAGLFSNPAFDIVFRYPPKKELKTNIEYSLTSSLIDLFLIPLRVKVAKAELEQITLRVTNEILDLAFEVEQTFYELQAAQQDIKYIQSIVELTSIHSQLTSRQRSVGNVNKLEFQQIQSRYLEAKLEVARIQNDIIRLREKLNRLLGFCGDIHWKVSDSLPEIDYQGLPIDCLESVAFSERLDLQSARFDVLRLSRMLGIKQWWVYTQGRLGIGGERDPDGTNLIGPAFSGEIPIFNYGQADRMRIHAELRQAKDHLAALEIQILSEVREAHKLLMNNLGIINDYRAHIIPLQSEILESSEELYNVMGLGIDRLLENKRQEFQAYSNYIMSLRNYWMARVQLDRALGGKLYLVLSQIGCEMNSYECTYEGVSE